MTKHADGPSPSLMLSWVERIAQYCNDQDGLPLIAGRPGQPAHPAGQATVYYRVDDTTWESGVRRQIASLAQFGEITRDGMQLLGRSTQRASRLRAAHDVFAWMAAVFAAAPSLKRNT